jgi:hypothetical protein
MVAGDGVQQFIHILQMRVDAKRRQMPKLAATRLGTGCGRVSSPSGTSGRIGCGDFLARKFYTWTKSPANRHSEWRELESFLVFVNFDIFLGISSYFRTRYTLSVLRISFFLFLY